MQRSPKLFIIVCAVIFLTAIVIRLISLESRGLEYDEVWTLFGYVDKGYSVIFGDIETPNNHVLNTILIKWTTAILGDSNTAIRLPALFAGILTIVFTTAASWMLFRTKIAILAALLMSSFNAALIHFSETARGYSIQTALFAILIFAIIRLERYKDRRMLYLIFLSPVLMTLTLPTSVLYIFPVAASHLIYLFHKKQLSLAKQKSLLIVYSLSAFLCAGWLFSHYDDLLKAQARFGTELKTISDIWIFISSTMQNLSGVSLLFIIPFGLFFFPRYRWTTGVYLFILSVPFLAALIGKAGPDRAYLPLLVPAIIMMAGFCSKLLKGKKIIRYILLSSCFAIYVVYAYSSYKQWTPPDWREIYKQIKENIDAHTLIVFKPLDIIPAIYNNPELIQDYFNNIQGSKSSLMQINLRSAIGSYSETFGEENSPIPESIKAREVDIDNIPCSFYSLKKVSKTTEGNAFFIIIMEPVHYTKFLQFVTKHLDPKIWKPMNLHLKSNADSELRYGVSCTDKNPFSVEEMLRIEASYPFVRFYTLESMPLP